ncbi:MAG: amino acid adenylation domain-containing protein [Bacteroidales bacterium]|nr:amino acid adenylation domain-containing protein [Bacteroidales bacterium]
MNKAFKLDKTNIENIVDLTSLQEGILFHYLKDVSKNLYFVQLSLEIQGSVEFDYFREAWNKVVVNNEMLRTVYRWEKLNKPVQVILKEKNVDIRYYDLSKEENILESEYQKIKHKDNEENFDLRDVPFRLTLCKIKADKYKLLISNHHIIYDGWSNGIILKEFLHNYHEQVNGSKIQILKKTSFNEYVKLNKKLTLEGQTFWKDYLNAYEVNSIFSSKRNNVLSDKSNESYKQIIPEKKVQLLKSYCELHRLTIADILYNVWGILLSKYSGKEDILFGTTVSGRNIKLEGIEEIVGLFINTIPLRISLPSVKPLLEIIKTNANQLRKRVNYENVPLHDILNDSSYKSDELIESIFVIENYPIDTSSLQQGDGLAIKSFDIKESTNYKLTVSAFLSDEIEINFNYFNSDFDRIEIENINRHFIKILDSIINHEESNIQELELLSESEKQQLLYDFNDTELDFPRDKAIHDLFEEQARKTPNADALVRGNHKLNYKEFNQEIDKLSNVLINKGIKCNDFVAIFADQSIEFLISIFAVLKAGGAYVPIDDNYPESRKNYIIKDCDAKIILSTKSVRNNNKETLKGIGEDQIVNVDELDNYKFTVQQDPIKLRSDNLIYLIYTSGSTGNPKGAAVYHKSFANLLNWFISEYTITVDDRVLLMSSTSFDLTQKNLFAALLCGGSLHLLPRSQYDPDIISDIISKDKITWVNCTPSAFYPIVEIKEDSPYEKLFSLRYVFLGGEPILMNKLSAWISSEGNKTKIVNTYGPTEATDICSSFIIESPLDYLEGIIPIGKPIYNVHILILDKNYTLVPIGMSGELCISGAGLGLGYVNNPELTSDKFIDHPYKEGERLYRTGDLVRWLSDGNIEFLGRIDHQVKIRGFRIEVGEIEHILLKHENIKESIVLALEDNGDKYLCAYLVTEDYFNQEELRTYLSASLPDYMIPSYIVELDSIPLTPNGKVDRKSLPTPEIKAGGAYVAPKSLVEVKLVKIWSEVLNIVSKEISTNVSFFELGGHSLKAIVLVSQIHKELNVRLELREIFESQSIQRQAILINSSENTSYFSIPKAKKQEYYLLSSSQRRLYLLQQMDLGSTAYNMPGLLAVPEGQNKHQITDVFNKLIARHENFRTSFEVEDETPVQRIHSEVIFSIKDYQITKSELSSIKEELTQSFDLKLAPLLRIAYLEISDGDDMLFIDMHHIISDGRSHSILEDEFNHLIEGKEIEPLRLHYKDYSEWQNSPEQQGRIKGQEAYWIDKFVGELPVLELPIDYPRPVIQSFEGASVSFMLSEQETKIIHDLCKEHGLTLYMSLLSVFTILLSKLSGQEALVIGSPIATRRHADLNDVVGMFVNTLAIRLDVSGYKRVIDYLQDIKENALEAYENQEYQFEDLVEKLAVNRDASRNPLFDVVFNLLEETSQESTVSTGEKLKHVPGVSKFDLSLTALDLGSELELSFEYGTKLFKAETITRFIGYIKQIINQLPEKLNEKLSRFEIITEVEKQQILNEFNDTQTDYPDKKAIHELFIDQVELSPTQLAIEDQNYSYSYKELDEASNKLANCLQQRSLKSDQLVGLITNRSIEMIVGILGILKSGCAYVPIDDQYPAERINQILSESGINLIVSTREAKLDISFSGEVILIDGEEVQESRIDIDIVRGNSQGLAYVMYTSGSTGRPKGVEIEHKSVVRLVKNTNYVPSNFTHKILLTGAPVFDATSFEIWTALLNGGSIFITDNDVITNAVLLGECIRINSISTLWLTSSLFNQLVESDETIFDSLAYLLVGGDVLSVKHISKIRNRNTELVIINGYGPTENTTFSTTFKIEKEYKSNIPIGKPISNSTAYIFNSNNQLQPLGVAGELLVGGDGLARAYLNDKDLTSEKFIAHPFTEGARLYRTGDLVRWLPDGNIEFLGRIDHQVKIRGFRIELGEIEISILKYSEVNECVVLCREDQEGDKYLCAYVVSNTKENDLEQSLRLYLSGILPDYMLPSYFVALEKIPLNSNGKIDKKLLPKPEIKAGGGYVAASTLIESKLVKIWSEVLNIPSKEISTRASFFELGGHSLKVTVLVSRIHKELDVRLELRDIFRYQSVQSQSKLIASSETVSYFSIPKAKDQEYYPLSSSQRRLYLLQQMDLKGTAYNMPGIIEMPSNCTKEQIISVFDKLIARHENFRTSFEIENEFPVQRIHTDVSLNISNHQIRKEELSELQKDFKQAFDLSKAPLLRVGYLEVLDGQDLLLFDMHHIISDGESHRILQEEFYDLLSGKDLQELELQYKDYSEWQNSEEQQKRIQGQESYWLEKFSEEAPVLELPTDNMRPVMQSFEGARVSFVLSQEETQIIQNICKEQGLTMYMSLLSVYTILLSKLSRQEDIIVGSPIAARRHSDLERIVGMFINTLALRNEVSGDKRLVDYLQDLKESTLEAYENQEYQFEDLVEDVVKERDTSRNPLFDVMFNLLNQVEHSVDLTGLDNQNYIHTPGISKFDLTLTAVDYGEQLLLSFEYCTKLFKAETIERFIRYFKQIVTQISQNSEIKLSAIEIISAEEKQQVLYDFNAIKIDYPKEKTIYELFEEQVEKSPDNIALVYDDKNLSFDELNRYSSYYALNLLDQGAKGGEIIGIIQERSINMIIGILAILKAGCAYCPINPETPQKRIQFILKECNIKILIAEPELLKNDQELSRLNCINLNSDNIQTIQSGIDQILQSRRSQDITSAYIIFTSGSTGNPKGVIINHSNIFPLLYWGFNYLHLDKDDKVIQNLAFYFDWSVWEIFISLTSGSSLELVSKETILDDEKYNLLINKKCITVIHITPTQFQSLTTNNKKLTSIRHLCIGAEKLTLNLVKRSYEVISSDCIVYNMYWPTEATIMSSILTIRKSDEDTYESLSSIPIGRAIAKGGFVILNQYMQIQPVNITGELYISGEGLSIGYINDPEKTVNSFIKNIYKSEGIKGEFLYKTGDLARWLHDGSVEFLGRIDHQVKIRGFRIELGEIENAILKHENIKDSVIIDIEENGEKYLCAYLVKEEEFNEEEIRSYLSVSLPDYMIPSYFVELDKIPLNSNGKVNRKALPLPEIKAGNDYVAPSNETEEKLAQIWSEVLNIEKEEISTTANFFSIGGHSLKASVLTGRIHKEIGVEFPLRDVFLHSSIQAQASQINTRDKKDFVSIPKAKEQEYYPLSSAQKRLYLLQEMEPDSKAYNMPYTISLEVEAEKEKIEEAFRQLISRHESFRTSFEIEGEEPVQHIHEQLEFKLEELTITKEEVQEKRQQFIQAFNLSQAPLLRAAKVNIQGEGSLLMIDMHHIISDGVSHAILEQDFQRLYTGEELAPLSLQYKDYSEWQNSEEQKIKVKEQEDYWIRKFEEEIPELNLSIDKVRPAIQSHEGASVSFALSKEETQQIKSLANENDLTVYMSVLSLLNILLSKLSGQEDIVVGTPIAGRNHRDLENIVGMFVNTLAIRNEVNGSNTLKEFVEKLKQNTLEAYENQDYQFEDLVENISIERDISRNPVFDVMFSFQNQTDSRADLSGLESELYVHTSGISKFDLTLTAVDYGEQLMLSFEYCTKLFKAETIDRYIGYFKRIVNQLTINSERELSAIEIISKEEKQQLLYDFNDIKIDYPKEKTIYELFEDQVEKHPDNIALAYDDKNLTFDELNKYSNYYALNLLDQGAKEGEIIGIIQERSLNMIIGILAILKAGCAYCPINPETPQKRIEFILKECNIKILISDLELVNMDAELSKLNCINLDSNKIQYLQSGIDQVLQSRRSKDITSAYIIFTSGSTGNPKGVLINHSNIFPLLYWGFKYLRLDKQDKVIQNLAFYFDWSVWEIFISLTSGSSLELVSKETMLDDEKYTQLINKKSITVIHITPTQFQSLTTNNKKLSTLRHLCIGAEKLTLNLFKRSYEVVSSDCNVYNMYGPTEATIMSAVLTVRKNEESTYESLSSIPIGAPIAKGGLVILNQYKQIQPVNIAGELYISGEGLSIGYINDPEKTSNSFIKNTYKSDGIKGEYLYKTGDLARWLSDGTVEFLGRIDHQVKIRGFRIELGEIENTLLKHENIKESVVIDIEANGEKYLCAYLVIKEDFNEDEIRRYLSESLPDYMIPSYFEVLDKIPLNSNGKVNRKTLPSPEVKAGEDYVAPSNETEEKLVEIWSEVLNIKKEEISTTANFFDIGGHSLKIISLNKKINNCFNTNIEVTDMFRLTTIESLAIKICKNDNGDIITAISDDNIEETVDVMDEYLTFMESEENE